MMETVSSQMRKRTSAIKELSIYEPGMLEGPGSWSKAVVLDKLDSKADGTGGILGALLQHCPSLLELTVLQSTLPLTVDLVTALANSTPKLQSLTFRAKHCDAAALALAVEKLRDLTELDVSGARTCSEFWCIW